MRDRSLSVTFSRQKNTYLNLGSIKTTKKRELHRIECLHRLEVLINIDGKYENYAPKPFSKKLDNMT